MTIPDVLDCWVHFQIMSDGGVEFLEWECSLVEETSS